MAFKKKWTIYLITILLKFLQKCYPLLECMAKQSLPVLEAHAHVGTDNDLFYDNSIRQILTGVTKEELEKNDIHHYGHFMRSGFDVLYSLCKDQATTMGMAEENLYEFGVFVAESVGFWECFFIRLY